MMRVSRATITSALRYPVETISFFLVVAISCYLSLIFSSTSTWTHQVALSNGSLYTVTPTMIPKGKVLMKQVVVTLPKSHIGSEPGVLSKPVVDTLQSLHSAVLDLHISGEVGNELRYGDLCWKHSTECVQETPLSIFSDTNSDPISAINQAYDNADNTRIFELGFKGLVRMEQSNQIIGAESFVFSYFFNVTTPPQQHLASIWEKRLGALKLENFYSNDLSQNFHTVLPDGKVVYDIFEGINKAKQLLQVKRLLI